MPLFVPAKSSKISRDEVHSILSSKYQNSWFDPYVDVGAGAEHSPYRWNGLTWTSSSGNSYLNERVIGTQATAWHFVAVVNPTAFPPMRALLYFGVDDHTWSPKVPLFGGATNVDISYDDKNCSSRLACRQENLLPGSIMEFDWNSAFWVNTAVAKSVYSEMDRAASIVEAARCSFEDYLSPLVESATEKASALFSAGKYDSGVDTLTDLAVRTSKEATKRWKLLWQQLLVTNADGCIATSNPDQLLCGCTKTSAKFSTAWLDKVVADTGDHYAVPVQCSGYIDPDGHCQEDLKSVYQRNVEKSISKFDVKGVVH